MTVSIHAKSECEAVGCDNCAVGDICTKYAEARGKDISGGLTRFNIKSKAGEHVYWAGDTFDHLYAVKSGCIKSYTLDEEGNERIRGFYLPGDLLGLDALYADEYTSSACALVATEVCSISFEQLSNQVASRPNLQRRLLQLMSKDLSTAMALAGDYSAEQRMAAFMLHLHEREQSRSIGAPGEITLLMPRRDIANFLRLAPETASRVLSRFQQQGYIKSAQHSLRLLNPDALWRMAQPVGIVSPTYACQAA